MEEGYPLSKLSLRQLHYIDLLYNFRHFGKAAEAAGISQPALSTAIAKVESIIGSSLFYRDTHYVSPTRYGEIVARRAPAILNDMRHLDRELGDLRERRESSFSFGTGNLVADTVLPDVLSTFTRQVPVFPRFVIGYWHELRARLFDNSLSFYLTANHQPTDDPELALSHLYDEEIVFFGRHDHPIFAERSISCRHIVQFPLVTYQTFIAKTMVRERLETQREFELFAKNFPSSTVESIHIAALTIAHSDWLMMGPMSYRSPQLESGEIVRLDVVDFSLTLQIMAAQRAKSLLSPGEQELLHILVDTHKNLARCDPRPPST